jgi:succinate dehydrogenase/fumarate reductase flavoprotein subunit
MPSNSETFRATAQHPDLVVIGAGAGGMTAALTAALHGLKVVLCEATDQVGGTTATSAGTVWIPGNRHGLEAGFDDSTEKAHQYLQELIGPMDPGGLRAAYLSTANEAIAFLEARSEVRFVSAGKHPDYLELPGAAISGRALGPVEFDGRRLGREFSRVRAPMPDFMLLGGMMAGKADIKALVGRYRSIRNFLHSARLVMRFGRDRLKYPRGTRLVMGNALVARLYYSLLQAGVQIRFNTSLVRLERLDGRVVGAVVHCNGTDLTLHAERGVVLATGGIGHQAELRGELSPGNVTFSSLAFGRNQGDGILAARRAGAQLAKHTDSFFWQPVSRVPEQGGRSRLFPHLYLDRTKPGIIAVDSAGERFVNEAASYHHFVEAMLKRNETVPAVPGYFVCDARFIRTYGLGVIPPGTRNLRPFEKSGYITTDADLTGLAKKLGISADGLAASVEKNNRYAAAGKDVDFGKGDVEMNRFNGDPEHGPNPCLGPISVAPFCALPVWPADAATSTGLATNADGAVLGSSGAPIPGLYACGNDMASIMNGTYPGPGITIGPAMVFGYRIGLRAKHAVPEEG